MEPVWTAITAHPPCDEEHEGPIRSYSWRRFGKTGTFQKVYVNNLTRSQNTFGEKKEWALLEKNMVSTSFLFVFEA